MTNTALLVGNLGADPEFRSADSGTDIASFSLGTSRPKVGTQEGKGGRVRQDKADFSSSQKCRYVFVCTSFFREIVCL